MDMLYQFVEVFATYIEWTIVVAVASSMAQRKYTGKKHILLVCFFTFCATVLITYLNTLHSFSYITIGIGLIYSFVAVIILSSGNLLLKATSTVLIWVFMFAVDYILVYSILMIIGRSINVTHGVSLIMTPGTLRTIFLVTDKLIQVMIFAFCHKLYSKLQLLNKKNMKFLFAITLLSYMVMQILTALTITDSLLTIQITVIFTTFFIVLSLIATLFAITISAKHQNEKRTLELMKLSSQMMEKNYSEIHNSHEIIRQQIHDFKNHLRIINDMSDSNPAVKKYTQKLLESSYSYAKLCHCGNDIIDSIINCKEAEAKEKNIHFEYNISLTNSLSIKSVDICAILANQIDNAIEACEKIETVNNRKIGILISQKEAFVLFKVQNTVKENPFNKNSQLFTSKSNDDGLHGFGIRIIRETADKYNGTSENSYEDGQFISSVMLLNND